MGQPVRVVVAAWCARSEIRAPLADTRSHPPTLGPIARTPIGIPRASRFPQSLTAHLVHVRRTPEKERNDRASLEITRLQDLFAINRIIGAWKSPYPQMGFSKVLGCSVREVQAKDMIR